MRRVRQFKPLKDRLRFCCMAAALPLAVLGARPAAACGIETNIGDVCYFAFDYCPAGFLPANGAILNITRDPVLFALLGTTYGGDGTTTFGVPDLAGRAAAGTGEGTGLTLVERGTVRGSLTATLPPIPHSHSVSVKEAAVAAGTGIPAGTAQQVNVVAPAAGAPSGLTANAASLVGNGTPVSIMPPYVALTACIATTGSFPIAP